MNHQLSILKAAKIDWLLQIKKRMKTLSRGFETHFHEVYPSAHKNGGIRAALACLAVIEEIEEQLNALRSAVCVTLSAGEQEILHRECRSRRADAYDRAIDRAIARLKAEMKEDAAMAGKGHHKMKAGKRAVGGLELAA
jgi:hypothetical protein